MLKQPNFGLVLGDSLNQGLLFTHNLQTQEEFKELLAFIIDFLIHVICDDHIELPQDLIDNELLLFFGNKVRELLEFDLVLL